MAESSKQCSTRLVLEKRRRGPCVSMTSLLTEPHNWLPVNFRGGFKWQHYFVYRRFGSTLPYLTSPVHSGTSLRQYTPVPHFGSTLPYLTSTAHSHTSLASTLPYLTSPVYSRTSLRLTHTHTHLPYRHFGCTLPYRHFGCTLPYLNLPVHSHTSLRQHTPISYLSSSLYTCHISRTLRSSSEIINFDHFKM